MAEIAQPRTRDHLIALAFALLGGVIGIFAAAFEELRSGAGILVPFIVAPMAEEGLKPIGIYLLLYRSPHILRGQLYTATLTALSGLCFGVIESIVYVTVYAPDQSQAYFIYRFSVTLALHMAASFIVGLGINRPLLDWANGLARFPKRTRNAFVAAVLLHAAYNITAVSLELSGVLDFG